MNIEWSFIKFVFLKMTAYMEHSLTQESMANASVYLQKIKMAS